MTLYKKTQYGKLLISVLLICSVTSIALTISSNSSIWITVFIASIFIITLLLFYKLTITITKEKIEAKFGIGLIKRTLKIKDINYNTIEEIKIPALYGIGIRITPHGILYNVKIGSAIKIKSNTKTFFVGTEDFDTINNVLQDLKLNN